MFLILRLLAIIKNEKIEITLKENNFLFPVLLSEQLPGQGTGLLLPVVAEAPGTQHLEHGQVGAIRS